MLRINVLFHLEIQFFICDKRSEVPVDIMKIFLICVTVNIAGQSLHRCHVILHFLSFLLFPALYDLVDFFRLRIVRSTHIIVCSICGKMQKFCVFRV